ncbi:MAG: acyl-[ACP]--phospholipid O-acyltransferase [Kiritimatiellia bacterium]|jgi:acyl-[acyl-carrier-protein]-phospholipid O-acyltransferase/long-chain-fatty-acid--[acyl-carrier-protein] ligase|nr:acyl-[ACP]--phospholipid O-acyltransferase [Kiritimatiellia bacterium]MDP6848075.1 acyl-[ACP]--phospholipid O-acyltransferase [Kiritimatiellia bacterium]
MQKKEHIPKGFLWLNVTQFFGALNDNVFQLLVIFFLGYLLKADRNVEASIMSTAGIVFVLPFLLFSHAAGVLADRFSKRNIIVFTKCLEVVVMAGGFVAVLHSGPGSPTILYAMIFLMCTQSTIFGPSKYGIIPELVRREELSKANSFLVGLTYLAIILGTFLPSYVVARLFPGNYIALAGFCVVISFLGLAACLRISETPAAGERRSFTPFFFVDIFKTLYRLRTDRYLLLTVLGSAYFLALGGFIKFNLILYGSEHLGLMREQAGYLFPVAALGIGLGALLSGKLSGRNIEFGVVPLGAMGLTVTCILYAVIPEGAVISAGIISFFVGISSGLFIVPLNAFVQERAPRNRLGEILACQNFLSFLGVGLAMGLLKLLVTALGLSSSMSFLVVGLLTGILAVLAIAILPDFLVRFVVVVITRLVYRVKIYGLDNLPSSGPALLVSNHVTWVDALLISATQQRRIRFIMSRQIYEGLLLKPLFRLMGVIQISADDPPRRVVASINEARAALNDGSLVCIFAEGAITRNGNLRAFRPGLEKIAKGCDCPIVPVYIGGAWGSIFSYYHGKILSRLPAIVPYEVSVTFGERLPSSSSTREVRQAVMELSEKAFGARKTPARSLPRAFIGKARASWFRPCMGDTSGKRLSFGETLVSSVAMAEQLDRIVGDQEKVGVLLPTSAGGALVNVALSLRGRVPVNLNYTASAESVRSAIRQCGIGTVISSRVFMEKMDKLSLPEGTVFVEDIVVRIGKGAKVCAWLKAVFLPASMLMRFKKRGPDDLATVIFSSGSTGEPKGVMLSHHNIISNIESFAQAFRFDKHDRVCGILPFFHSFGFTVTLWAPLVRGFYVLYHPNPADGSKVAEMCREDRLTAMLSTPTFLLAYIRKAKKEDFQTLRGVVTGAEKLRTKVADAFEKRFGFRPLEGYGTTELSPVCSLNIPNVDVGGVQQVGTKEGSIGHPIPGVAMKVVDLDTGEDLPMGEEGLLMVKGPNVMMGYLGNPDKTSEVLRAGWYNTGDIAKLDDDGFAFILDRLSRFSKIGGEMVPHLVVEEKITQSIDAVGNVVCVTSVPDEKKGEQLVVLYTDDAGPLEQLKVSIKNSDLPNLWRPRDKNYFKVESLPVLGSGKLDLKRIKVIANEFVEKGARG